MFTTIVTVSLAMALTLAEQNCNTYPNYDTSDYTYTVCTGTPVYDLETGRQFCQDEVENGDLVTFPNYAEYQFLISVLNRTMDSYSFRYSPGFYQKSNNANRYLPQTGQFYWIDDPDTQVTNESVTYWEPFDILINNFDEQALVIKQAGTFVLDINGRMSLGVTVKGGKSQVDIRGNVICSRKGVPELPTPSTPALERDRKQVGVTEGSTEPKFQYWIAISVAGGVIALGLVLGVISICVFKKMKHKKENSQKFQKVPQADNQLPAPHQFSP